MNNCWYCEKPVGWENEEQKERHCVNCGMLNDRNPYRQLTEAPQPKEEEMILGGKFLKTSDCKTGDTIEILDGGIWEESRSFKNDDGTPKHQCQFQIKHGGEEKTMSMNKTNRDALINAWGRDTEKWIGKTAEITLKEVEVAGKDTTVVRLKPVV